MASGYYPKVYLYRRVVQAKLFIDRHYAGPIDIGNISGEAYFSKFHFIRLFSTIYGHTPHQYLTFVRIEKAKQLLSAGSRISDTCILVGFESLSSFSGLFKRVVGMSPSAFVLQQQQRQKAIIDNPLHFIPGCFAAQHGWSKNSNFEEVIV